MSGQQRVNNLNKILKDFSILKDKFLKTKNLEQKRDILNKMREVHGEALMCINDTPVTTYQEISDLEVIQIMMATTILNFDSTLGTTGVPSKTSHSHSTESTRKILNLTGGGNGRSRIYGETRPVPGGEEISIKNITTTPSSYRNYNSEQDSIFMESDNNNYGGNGDTGTTTEYFNNITTTEADGLMGRYNQFGGWFGNNLTDELNSLHWDPLEEGPNLKLRGGVFNKDPPEDETSNDEEGHLRLRGGCKNGNEANIGFKFAELTPHDAAELRSCAKPIFNKNIAERLGSNKHKVEFNPEEMDLTKDTLVNYWADWCSYSLEFWPEWLKFKEIAPKEFPGLQLADLNVVRGNDILNSMASAVGIEGFPTIVLFRNGHDIYKKTMGNGKVKNIVDFVKEHLK